MKLEHFNLSLGADLSAQCLRKLQKKVSIMTQVLKSPSQTLDLLSTFKKSCLHRQQASTPKMFSSLRPILKEGVNKQMWKHFQQINWTQSLKLTGRYCLCREVAPALCPRFQNPFYHTYKRLLSVLPNPVRHKIILMVPILLSSSCRSKILQTSSHLVRLKLPTLYRHKFQKKDQLVQILTTKRL